MASGDSPAVARRRVRLAVRAARETKGLTQGHVAEAMEWSLSKVMRIESGEVTISPIDLRALLAYLEVTGTVTVQSLVDDAKLARRRQAWWSEPRYRENLPPGLWQRIQFEADATVIRHFHGTLVPGPLQTAEYVTAVLESLRGDLTDEQIAVRREVRLRRQRELFERRTPPQMMVMLDESVLYREVGGPEVMGRQLQDLLNRVDEGSVLVRIVPFVAAAPIALMGPFVILDLGDEQNALLYREDMLTDQIVEDEAQVLRFRAVYEQLWSKALSDEDSAAEIEARMKKMLLPGRRRKSSNHSGMI